jgi:hypothetical protein
MPDHPITRYFRLLEKDGWKYQEAPPEGGTSWWIARFPTPRRRVEVYLALNEDCLAFQMPVTAPSSPTCRTALWRYLLYLNQAMKIAKFALDPDDQIVLAAEVPAAAITFGSFKGTLAALSTYFEHYHREIELLAANRLLAEAWLSLAPEVVEEPLMIEILSRERNAQI